MCASWRAKAIGMGESVRATIAVARMPLERIDGGDRFLHRNRPPRDGRSGQLLLRQTPASEFAMCRQCTPYADRFRQATLAPKGMTAGAQSCRRGGPAAGARRRDGLLTTTWPTLAQNFAEPRGWEC